MGAGFAGLHRPFSPYLRMNPIANLHGAVVSGNGLAIAGLLTLAILACNGCRQATQEAALAQDGPAGAAQRETWNVCYIGGSKVGYERTAVRPILRNGEPGIEIEGLVHLTVKRFNDATEMEVRFQSNETAQGKLLDFESTVSAGVAPLVTTGKVDGNLLRITTTTQGKSISTSIPWSDDWGGFLAVEQSLQRKPMAAGERRTLRALAPGSNQVADVELVAVDHETVKLLAGAYDLLRIESLVKLPGGQSIRETLWTDRTGEILRRKADAMNLESFRATKEVALEEGGQAAFDLGEGLAVKIGRPLERPHQTARVRYRVSLQDGDPAAVFTAGPSQQVKPLESNAAEVTVYALRPDSEQFHREAPEDPAGDEYRRPNNFIQSDDLGIVAMAEKAAGGIEDPWQVALALERYVQSVITKRDYTQAFATAAEVAQTGAGDCTEHAVLLAALARARGIASRVAVGLVYMPSHQAFGYHMWNEVYIGDRWIPVDATLAMGGIGAAHLKLAHHSLDGAAAYVSFLPIAQVAGRLKIEVIEVE